MRKLINGLLLIFLLVSSNLAYSAFFYYGQQTAKQQAFAHPTKIIHYQKPAMLVKQPVSNAYSPMTTSYLSHQNEHLYRIALRMKPANVSVQQVMIALLYANPLAFANHNINGLKPGYHLQLPPFEEIAHINPILANHLVGQQNHLWFKNVSNNASKQKKVIAQVIKKAPVQLEANIPSIENEPVIIKTADESSHSPTSSSLVDLVNNKPVEENEATLPEPAAIANVEPAKEASNALQATQVISEKVNGFISETKHFEQQTNTQIASLEQHNKILETKLNQLSNQLKGITYHLVQLTPKNQSKRQAAVLLENLHKNAVELSSGVIALVLISFLLARTFKNKPKKDELRSEMSIPSKLDLARAYFDMGDHSSAKSVLQEVILNGDEDQRKGATDLLGKINKA